MIYAKLIELSLAENHAFLRGIRIAVFAEMYLYRDLTRRNLPCVEAICQRGTDLIVAILTSTISPTYGTRGDIAIRTTHRPSLTEVHVGTVGGSN